MAEPLVGTVAGLLATSERRAWGTTEALPTRTRGGAPPSVLGLGSVGSRALALRCRHGDEHATIGANERDGGAAWLESREDGSDDEWG